MTPAYRFFLGLDGKWHWGTVGDSFLLCAVCGTDSRLFSNCLPAGEQLQPGAILCEKCQRVLSDLQVDFAPAREAVAYNA